MNAVLIMGASGLLGPVLYEALKLSGLEVKTLAKNGKSDINIDACSPSQLESALEAVRPNVIINLIGLTSVEQCEEAPNTAYLLNTKVVENIASWIAKQRTKRTHLIQVSTDHLYDGIGFHSENDITIRNTYALTKYAGEIAAQSVGASIVRTNFFGRSHVPHRESITDWVFNSLSRGEHVQVFGDVYFSPLSMTTLSEIIRELAILKPAGTFNLGSGNGMSKADFDFYFAELVPLPTKYMTVVSANEAKFLKARRPKNMQMNPAKIEDFLGRAMPTLEEEIEKAAQEYVK